MAREEQVVRRDNIIRNFILGGFVVVTGLAIFLSHAPLAITSRDWIADVAPLPQGADTTQLDRLLDIAGVIVVKNERRAGVEASGVPLSGPHEGDPRIGYSLHELVAFGLPFGASRDQGYVVYRDTGATFEMLVPAPDRLAEFHKQFGVDLDRGGIPPVLGYFWGWLVLLALGGIGLFELAAARHRREALGVM